MKLNNYLTLRLSTRQQNLKYNIYTKRENINTISNIHLVKAGGAAKYAGCKLH